MDDFSHCKQKLYFFIVVDNDTKKRLEVVPSRHQSEIVKILGQFKDIEIVTRDFSKA